MRIKSFATDKIAVQEIEDGFVNNERIQDGWTISWLVRLGAFELSRLVTLDNSSHHFVNFLLRRPTHSHQLSVIRILSQNLRLSENW